MTPTPFERFTTVRAQIMGWKHWPKWLPPVVARYVLGIVFAASGYSKLHDLGRASEFFGSLGIPLPGFMSAVVGTTEMLCGALLLVGLATRIATVPLMLVMIVAIAVGKPHEIVGLTTLAGTRELAYLALLAFVAMTGPGAFAADTWLSYRLTRMSPARKPQWTGPPASTGARPANAS